ncbi:MBL fold metallo-hydrolase [uncultured Dokdonia sp.]|uniref:MBL fold metallo-hydrolase n=1 Tax=uncultured Dokdonia sp. TaxID=575653 RepID=UPI0026173706|nr:MBL fold metallo-hydrolase [uncultured Dokdonia sp.]
MKKITLIALLAISYISCAQGRFDSVEIKVEPVSDQIYMLQGVGGNIGISVGDDGVFMIDDQFAPLTEKIIAAIKPISDKPVKFLVNTHFHGDHSGGNTNFEAAGAMIVAHDNVRKRLASNENTADSGLPVITFSDDATFYMNGNDIFITHVHNAHTDGDALVYFIQSNVLHTGDTFFHGSHKFPYIDIDSGGSLKGDIEAAKKGLLLINDSTKIIPGHGPVATKADYQKYHDMLVGIYKNVSQAIKKGKTEEEIVAMESLTADYHSDKEAESSFITGPKIRRAAYKSILTEKEMEH